MYSLIYHSEAKDFFELPQIYKMLSDSRKFNAKHQITGCLLFHNHQFIQLLEGDGDAVNALYDRISNDPRHTNVEMVGFQPHEERLFNQWSMAFYDFGDEKLNAMHKMQEINEIFDNSKILKYPSSIARKFFTNVREVLTVANP